MNLKGRCIRSAPEYLTKGKVYNLKLVKKGYNPNEDQYHIKWDGKINDPVIHMYTIVDYFEIIPNNLNKRTRTL